MKPASARPLPASQVTMILVALLALLILVLIGGSAFAASVLFARSKDAAHAQIDTEISAQSPARLEELKQYLAANADGIAKTSALTMNIDKYDQTTIVSTISGYAAKAGVSITSLDFGTGAASTPGAGAAPTAAGGNSVSVTLASPIPYTKFITFLKLLEQGVMPAEITAGDVTAGNAGSGLVNVSPLAIKVAG